MSERHKRKNAREMLSKAGYKAGGHFATKKMIGEAVREHESHDHPDKPKTKLKLKDGGTVQSAAFGARIHKPRGHKGKKPHTTVNVVVGAGGGPKPVPIPVPMGGPSMGAPPPPGGMPGMPPQGPMPGANRGGRFCDGGSVKDSKASQRDTIKSEGGKVEGKLKKGGKTKRAKNKYDIGGPIAANPWGNNVMGVNPGGGPTSAAGGGPGNIMQVHPNGPGMASGPGATWGGGPLQGGPSASTGWGSSVMQGNAPVASPTPRPGGMCAINDGKMNKGGRAKTADPEMDAGAGGGLGRLEKAESYGAKVKKGGKVKH